MGDVEFVHDVTSSLPSRVIGQLMGLPEEDLPMIHRLAEMNTSSQDVDPNTNFMLRHCAGCSRLSPSSEADRRTAGARP